MLLKFGKPRYPFVSDTNTDTCTGNPNHSLEASFNGSHTHLQYIKNMQNSKKKLNGTCVAEKCLNTNLHT